MKRNLVLAMAMICLAIGVRGQSPKAFKSIDKHARYDDLATNPTIESLADYLAAPARNETEKVRAIYVWLTSHISYSDTTVTNNWLGTVENTIQQRAENVLKNRTAVCEGYANLFVALCKAAGIRAVVVEGQVKDSDGTVSDVGHAWNAVEIDGQWQLSDPTWGAGYTSPVTHRFIPVYQEQFFLMTPQQALTDHLPDDPIWQLLEHPVSEAQFSNALFTLPDITEPGPRFSYRDSINRWLALDSMEQRLDAIRRTLRFNPGNSLALARLGSYFINEAVIKYDKVDDLVTLALNEHDLPIDTAFMRKTLRQAEAFYLQGWTYYQQVTDPGLRKRADLLLPPEKNAATALYVQGLIEMAVLFRDFKKATQQAFLYDESIVDVLLQQSRKAINWFDQSEARIDPDLEDQRYLYKLLGLSRIQAYYMRAKIAMQYYADFNSNMEERNILKNLKALDGVANDLEILKMLVSDVDVDDLQDLESAAVAEEVPNLFAALEEARGMYKTNLLHLQYDAVSKKLNPENVKRLLDQVPEIDQHFIQSAPLEVNVANVGNEYVPKSPVSHNRSLLYAFAATVRYNLIVAQINGAGTTAALAKQKTALVNGCKEVDRYLDKAIELRNQTPVGPEEKEILLRLKSKNAGLMEEMKKLR